MLRELRTLRRKLGREKDDVTEDEYKNIIKELSQLIETVEDRGDSVLTCHDTRTHCTLLVGLGHELNVAENREDVEKFCHSINGLLYARSGNKAGN